MTIVTGTLARFKYLQHAHASNNYVTVIRDIGRHEMSVTNDAEAVVESVLKAVPETKKLLYYDSRDELSELCFKDGKFKTFASVPEWEAVKMDV